MSETARINELLNANTSYVEKNRKLREAGKKSAEKFRYYAENHRAKVEKFEARLTELDGTVADEHTRNERDELQRSILDTLEKARANDELAQMWDNVLEETSPT